MIGFRGLQRPALLLLTMLMACGGSSTTAPPIPQTSISYTATPVNAPSITLGEASKTSTSITLSVNASSVNRLYGVQFILVYDPAVLQFQNASEGSFLNQGGASTSFAVELEDIEPGPGVNRAPGRLVVGLTRLGAQPGVGGSGTLMTITLNSVASGTTGVSFEGPAALDPAAMVIPEVRFSGGAVTVRR